MQYVYTLSMLDAIHFTQHMRSIDHAFHTPYACYKCECYFADFQYSADDKYKDFIQSLVALPDNICYRINAMPWSFLVWPQIYTKDPRPCAILIVVRQVPAFNAIWARRQAQNAARHAKIMSAFVLRLFSHVWSAKTRIPPKLSPMADNVIHWVV